MAVRVVLEDGIVLAIMEGVLTPDDLAAAGDALATIESAGDVAPPRIGDLRNVTSLEVSYRDIMAYAGLRTRAPLSNAVRSAIVVADPVVRAAAAVFQIMNQNPNITVRMFEDIDLARAWVLDAKVGVPGARGHARKGSL